MKREAVIRLECGLRDDGSVHVSSPDVPLFHVVGGDAADAQEIAIAVLKEYLALNYEMKVDVRPVETLQSFLERQASVPQVSGHVIAEMAA